MIYDLFKILTTTVILIGMSCVIPSLQPRPVPITPQDLTVALDEIAEEANIPPVRSRHALPGKLSKRPTGCD